MKKGVRPVNIMMISAMCVVMAIVIKSQILQMMMIGVMNGKKTRNSNTKDVICASPRKRSNCNLADATDVLPTGF